MLCATLFLFSACEGALVGAVQACVSGCAQNLSIALVVGNAVCLLGCDHPLATLNAAVDDVGSQAWVLTRGESEQKLRHCSA